MSWMQYGDSHYEIGSCVMPERVTIADIAESLAKINRFTGHSRFPYSVARHCLFVSDLLCINPWESLYGLVHDVAETVVQDISWPLKKALPKEARAALDEIEECANIALYSVLKIPYPVPLEYATAVKRADWVAVATEKRDLLPKGDRDWDMLPYSPSHLKVEHSRDWADDAHDWLVRYHELTSTIGI